MTLSGFDDMTLIRGINNLKKSHGPSVVSIGNYDGVHLGHQHVINTLLDHSRDLAVRSTVITFEPLAKEFFRPQSVPRLTTIEDRAELLFGLGVDQVLCIDFNAPFASFAPCEFVEEVLLNGLGVKHLCVGDDFRFGKDRAGDFSLLERLGGQYGFDVTAHETFELLGGRVSSGRVRDALRDGRFDLAELFLGRPYVINGKVSKGQQLGRTIGFPTANIVLPEMLMPINGVFAVKVRLSEVGDVEGVANIGSRPTVDGKENRLEVHLFDFEGDLYNQMISVRFIKKIRNEHKFDNFDELKRQIQMDAGLARDILANN